MSKDKTKKDKNKKKTRVDDLEPHEDDDVKGGATLSLASTDTQVKATTDLTRKITPTDLSPDVDSSARPVDFFHERVEQFRKQVLTETLVRCEGNQTRAAKELGLQRTYLARLIRKYDL